MRLKVCRDRGINSEEQGSQHGKHADTALVDINCHKDVVLFPGAHNCKILK